MVTTSNMFIRLLAVVAVYWSSAVASPAGTHPQDAVITPGPKVDIRQLLSYNDPRFMGWEVVGGSIYQRTCLLGLTYTVSNGHFNCCPTTGLCSFATACAGISTALYATPSIDQLRCSTACVTGSLYWSTQDSMPYTYVGCGTGNFWVVQSTDSSGLLSWTPGVAAVVPTSSAAASWFTSTSTSVPTTTSSSVPTTPLTTVTTTPVPTIPTPAPATSSSSGGGGGGSSNNGAIIGGAVGGCAIAIGLIVLGILLFLRRKRNSNNGSPPAQQQPQHPYPNQQPPQQDMRPMSYIPPNSPPPPWDGGYAQQQAMAGQKQPYQYETVAKEDHTVHVTPYSPQPPQAFEMQGTPATHPMELQGAQRQ